MTTDFFFSTVAFLQTPKGTRAAQKKYKNDKCLSATAAYELSSYASFSVVLDVLTVTVQLIALSLLWTLSRQLKQSQMFEAMSKKKKMSD